MSTFEISKETIVNHIDANGYVPVPAAIGQLDIDSLFADFSYFTGELYDSRGMPKTKAAANLIDAFTVETPGRPRDGQGYLDRRLKGQINSKDPSDIATENKDVLHYVPLTAVMLQQRLGALPALVTQILEQCDLVHQEVKRSLRPIYQELGLEQVMLAPTTERFNDVHLVRVIRYLGDLASDPPEMINTSPDSIAQLHFDRSKFTAAVWEDRDGLVGTRANNLRGNPDMSLGDLETSIERALVSPIEHRRGEIKLFAGAGYNHLSRTERHISGNLPLLLHGVVDRHPGRERRAVVVFMNHRIGIERGTPETWEKSIKHLREKLARRASPTTA